MKVAPRECTVALKVACYRNVSMNSTQLSNILMYTAAEIISSETRMQLSTDLCNLRYDMLGKPLRNSRASCICIRVYTVSQYVTTISQCEQEYAGCQCSIYPLHQNNNIVTMPVCDISLRHFCKLLFTVGIRGFILLFFMYFWYSTTIHHLSMRWWEFRILQ